MQSSTSSLFEREIRAQIAAAELALAEAERRGDVLLVQAARGHLTGLQDLARRNGIAVGGVSPEPPIEPDVVLQTG